MKKFEKTVICCDVDGTFLGDNFKIPEANLEAIEYFRSEGGRFTFATGRTNKGLRLLFDKIIPDMPVVCQNGCAIYDYAKEKYLWHAPVSKKSHEVIDYIDKKYPGAGIELMSVQDAYCLKPNSSTKKHESDEKYTLTPGNYNDIHEDWLKIVFADVPPKVDEIQKDLENSPYYKEYQMVRSFSTYYEFFESGANKGTGVSAFEKMFSIGMDNLIVIGDNENDCAMLSLPCRSFAPSSAVQIAKDCVNTVLKSSNNDGVLKEVLELI